MNRLAIILATIATPFMGFAENSKNKNPPHSLQGLDYNSVALLIWDGKSLKLEYDGHYYELHHSEQCGCFYEEYYDKISSDEEPEMGN